MPGAMAFSLDLPYLAGFERAYEVRCEDPLAELWRFWLRYTDFPYLSREWPNHTDEEMTRVATFIRQAYELHSAAEGVTLLTRPLLIYYSLHNLGKAFLLLKNGITPPGYHGLAKVDVKQSLLDVSAETNAGLFLTISEEFGRQLPVGRRITFLELLRNALELEEPLSDYFKEAVLYESAEIEVFYGGKLTVKLECDPGQEETLTEKLGASTQLLRDFDATAGAGAVFLYPKTILPEKPPELGEAAYALVSPHLSFSVLHSGVKYRIKTALPSEEIPAAAAYLGYMFLLSSLVRYSPDALDRFVTSKKTSTEWFVAELCGKAARVLPNLFFNALHPYPFKFSA